MLIQILANTPLWVYGLFIFLLVFGFVQTRTRLVNKVPALLLPVGMIVLSLSGVHSSFGLELLPLAAWGCALIIVTVAGYVLFKDERIHFKASEGKYFIPGSWAPFMVMMAIFFAKYLYAVMSSLGAEIITTPIFIGTLAAVYGILSGYFASRAVNLISQAQKA
ncbi:hypothetical protein tinsulaeT_03130 [Thalassotalea insulae]|uniref:DUF1453 domain-containing protein n=1 Tax=Thalassotalea insulae TaxID=2056778 RepID=A0ABQ6GLV4_9GAMM|nr:DUF6622 family protein [Thalassotalea insulae]GLX76973.1 hypothetical protein tinsulaeT_03130 [Thalassotalea insulae]